MKKTRMYVIKLDYKVIGLLILTLVLSFLGYLCAKLVNIAPKPTNAVINISVRSAIPFASISQKGLFNFNLPKWQDILMSSSPVFLVSYNEVDADKVLDNQDEIKPTPIPAQTPAPTPVATPTPSLGDILYNDNVIESTITRTGESGYKSVDGIFINNQTDAEFDIEKLMGKAEKLKVKGSEPLVLVVHTHTSESYRPTSLYNYVPTDNDRTEDNRFNVVRVGEEFCKVLGDEKIPFIHDKSLNDYPSYNGSYQKTLGIIENYLKKYPSIKVVVDIHRDSILRDGKKLSLVFNHNNEKAAQVMLVVGTNKSGLNHPDWQYNLGFALKWQKAMLEIDPNLPRPVNLRKERFNGHVTKNAVILEVGTSANTLEEALVSARLSAKALANIIEK